MKPDANINRLWELRDYSDVDYTGDNDTRKSVTVYIYLINGTVIAWRLRSQKKLHYLLQKLNIQQSQSYFAKYYFSV